MPYDPFIDCSLNTQEFIHAARLGQHDLLKSYLKLAFNPNITLNQGDLKDRSALACAAHNGHLECVELLLNYKAKINSANPRHNPLLLATAEGHLEVCKRLVEAGADLHALNTHGDNVVYIAAGAAHLECVEFFLELGAAFDLPNSEYGATAIMAAAGFTRRADQPASANNRANRIMKKLIEAGAQINRQATHSGYSALMIAANQGSVLCAQTLIEAGADLHQKNDAGKTALNIAHERDECFGENAEMIGLITSAIEKQCLLQSSSQPQSQAIKHRI